MSTQTGSNPVTYTTTLEAVEFDKNKYNPMHSNINEWIKSMEALFEESDIDDCKRPLSAVGNIEGVIGTDLRRTVKKAEAEFGPIGWDQFKKFMIAFDDNFWKMLSSYEEFNDSSPPTTPDPACEDLILSNIGSDEESNHCSPSTSPDPTSEDEDLDIYPDLIRRVVPDHETLPEIYSLLKSPDGVRNKDELTTKTEAL